MLGAAVDMSPTTPSLRPTECEDEPDVPFALADILEHTPNPPVPATRVAASPELVLSQDHSLVHTDGAPPSTVAVPNPGTRRSVLSSAMSSGHDAPLVPVPPGGLRRTRSESGSRVASPGVVRERGPGQRKSAPAGPTTNWPGTPANASQLALLAPDAGPDVPTIQVAPTSASPAAPVPVDAPAQPQRRGHGRSELRRSITDVYAFANGRFAVLTNHRLGTGSFGDVYRAVDRTTGRHVALKLEPCRAGAESSLHFEYKVYRRISGPLADGSAPVGVPRVHYFGVEDGSALLAYDLLGPSLEDMFQYCGRRFSAKTVLLLGEQMLRRIEHVHARHFVHRDIKPDNMLLGVGSLGHCLFFIDYGLSKSYWDAQRGMHIPPRDGKSLTGTARYCSVGAHRCLEQGRRDDLESIAYVLIYFARGSLPWQGLGGDSMRDKMNRIGRLKADSAVDRLCQDCPPELGALLRYARTLQFDSAPDYASLRQLFAEGLQRRGAARDYEYDWILKRRGEHRTRSALSVASAAAAPEPALPRVPPQMQVPEGEVPASPPQAPPPEPAGTATPAVTRSEGTHDKGSAASSVRAGGGPAPVPFYQRSATSDGAVLQELPARGHFQLACHPPLDLEVDADAVAAVRPVAVHPQPQPVVPEANASHPPGPVVGRRVPTPPEIDTPPCEPLPGAPHLPSSHNPSTTAPSTVPREALGGDHTTALTASPASPRELMPSPPAEAPTHRPHALPPIAPTQPPLQPQAQPQAQALAPQQTPDAVAVITAGGVVGDGDTAPMPALPPPTSAAVSALRAVRHFGFGGAAPLGLGLSPLADDEL